MNRRGYYGEYGGAFIPEILVATFDELLDAFEEAKNDPTFWQEYEGICPPIPVDPLPSPLQKLSLGSLKARISTSREKT